MTIEPQGQGSPDPMTVQPQPFAEGPKDPPGGCGRPVLVGCGLSVVLTGMLLLVLLLTAGRWVPAVFRWSLEAIERQVTANPPPDLGPAERQRLAEAVDLAADAFEEGSADPLALQRLQRRIFDIAQKGRLSRQEILDLTEVLEDVAGRRAPPAEPEPQPENAEESLPLAWRAAPEHDWPPIGLRRPAA